MDRILTQKEVEKIKADLVSLFEDGHPPQDLKDHLAEMGMESPNDLPTGAYRPGVDRLSSGHWRMIADKWLEGIPGEASSLTKTVSSLDDILSRITPKKVDS